MLQPDAGVGGGSAVSVPVSVDTTLGYGDERIPFTEVYAAGGIDELKSAVENTLAITVDLWQAASPAEAEGLLAGAHRDHGRSARGRVAAGDEAFRRPWPRSRRPRPCRC